MVLQLHEKAIKPTPSVMIGITCRKVKEIKSNERLVWPTDIQCSMQNFFQVVLKRQSKIANYTDF